jgi:hypothetical protein
MSSHESSGIINNRNSGSYKERWGSKKQKGADRQQRKSSFILLMKDFPAARLNTLLYGGGNDRF